MSTASPTTDSPPQVTPSDRPTLAPRRVRVYLLLGDDWIDNGTGYCLGDIGECDTPFFVVRNEQEPGDIILESSLQGAIQYQRQQDTLIVWTDTSGKDLALSFQETDGCVDLCEFIVKVQREGFSPNISLYYVTCNGENGEDVTELVNGPVPVPDLPNTTNLSALLELLQSNCHSLFQRATLSRGLLDMDYLSHLVEVFDEAELAQLLLVILDLGKIVRLLVLLREQSLIEDIVSTPYKLHGIVGILEYHHPKHKAPFRDLLKRNVFKQVIELDRIELFHKDAALSFLKDVVLFDFIDEETFNVLMTLIHSNQQQIIEHLQKIPVLTQLFAIYDCVDHDSPVIKHDTVKFLHQYVKTCKALPRDKKLDFYSALVMSGLIKSLQFAFTEGDPVLQSMAIEIITAIIDFDIMILCSAFSDDSTNTALLSEHEDGDSVTDHPRQKELSSDMSFVSILAQIIVSDDNLRLDTQAFEALCDLLNPKIGNPPSEDFDLGCFRNDQGPATALDNPKDYDTKKYFAAFYTEVAPGLFQHLIDGALNRGLIFTKAARKLLYLCELVVFCAENHDQKIARRFVLENKLIESVARVLVLDCSFALKLRAVGCLKRLVTLNDDAYTQQIIDGDLFSDYFECFESVKSQSNMLNACCLSLLDLVLKGCKLALPEAYQNYRLLASYIVSKYADFCSHSISYVNTGPDLVLLVSNDFDARLSLAAERDADITEACDTKQTLGFAMEMPDTYEATAPNRVSEEPDFLFGIKPPVYMFENLEQDHVVDNACQKRHIPDHPNDIYSIDSSATKKSRMSMDPQFARALTVESGSPSNA